MMISMIKIKRYPIQKEADLEAQQWRPGAARHELEQRPLLVLAQPRHHLDQSEVSILVTDQSERGILAHLPER